jgi:hypothetical protein
MYTLSSLNKKQIFSFTSHQANAANTKNTNHIKKFLMMQESSIDKEGT